MTIALVGLLAFAFIGMIVKSRQGAHIALGFTVAVVTSLIWMA
jgi:hypothetical protein